MSPRAALTRHAKRRHVAGARRLRLLGLAATALIAVAVGTGAYATGAAEEIELDTVDTRFQLRGMQPASDRVAVVGVDDRTLAEFEGRWPLRRSLHARMVDRLADYGVAAIAYDVHFTERLPENGDAVLVPAIRRATRGGTPVVLAAAGMAVGGGTDVLGGGGALEVSGARAADATYLRGPDWVVRRFFGTQKGFAGFSASAVEAATGQPIEPGSYPDEGSWIDYGGDVGSIPTYSFARVLDGSVDPAALRDRIVVVGPTATSLMSDQGAPFDGLMPGPEIHANEISTALRGRPLKSAPTLLNMALILVCGAFAPAVGTRLRPPFPFLLSILAGLAFPILAMLAFVAGLVIAIVSPLVALAVGAVGTMFVNLGTSLFERAHTRATFARFVPADVVDDVLERADKDLRIGGMRCDATVLFSDIRGFTTFAESLAPDELVAILNRYLDEMTDTVMGHGGTLISYMGDGILAVFGAPLPQDDHADRAVGAAREMLCQKLPAFNRWLIEQGYERGFEIGVGLNSGEIFAGQVGAANRLEYTTIGDTTNTASRLEGMTKDTPHSLFFSEATRERLAVEPPNLVEVGELPVRGRARPISVWTIAAEQQDPDPVDLPVTSGAEV